MSKECVWIRDNETVVPKSFVERHTKHCIGKEVVSAVLYDVLECNELITKIHERLGIEELTLKGNLDK